MWKADGRFRSDRTRGKEGASVSMQGNRKEEQQERIWEDLSHYGGRILNSDEMRQAFRQKHHTLSTVGEHSLRVARTSLKICYMLNRLHVPTDIQDVVTASLCHDLGILGRDEKYDSMKECSKQHPADSVEVANKLVGELSEKTTDIISRHMWPVGKSKPPNSLEAAIVSAADKIAAVEDFVQGYEEKRPGITGVVRELMKRQKSARRRDE